MPPGDPALLVKWVFGPDHLAKQAGLKAGDIIVAVDGKPVPADESHLMACVRLRHPAGDKARLTLLRGKDRIDVLRPWNRHVFVPRQFRG